jgi:hypothetical protein
MTEDLFEFLSKIIVEVYIVKSERIGQLLKLFNGI